MDENERAPLFRPFSDPMTRGERLAAWIYLPLHAVGLPLLLSLLLTVWPDGGLTETDLNVVYYALGTVYMLAFLWRYFRRALDALLDNLRGALAALGIAYLIDLLLSWPCSSWCWPWARTSPTRPTTRPCWTWPTRAST